VILWRISNHISLAGEGALRASGRWHTRGRRVVYCAESPAAALLETLVHFEIDLPDLPARYRLLKVDAPDDASVERVSPGDLAADWVDGTAGTREIGDDWLAGGRSLLLVVPSAIVPETFNMLLNPGHAGASRVKIIDSREYVLDRRLLE
jgi:RES domain-containing protein